MSKLSRRPCHVFNGPRRQKDPVATASSASRAKGGAKGSQGDAKGSQWGRQGDAKGWQGKTKGTPRGPGEPRGRTPRGANGDTKGTPREGKGRPRGRQGGARGGQGAKEFHRRAGQSQLGGPRQTLSSIRTRLSQTGARCYLTFAGLARCGRAGARDRQGRPSGHQGVARMIIAGVRFVPLINII